MVFPARSIAVLALACSLAGLGCFEPLQSGGVMIVGDPGERIAAMCRFRHHDSVSTLCGDEDATGDFQDTSENPDNSSTNTGRSRSAPGR